MIRKKKIIVFEDFASIRAIIVNNLKKKDYLVYEATTLQEAETLLDGTNYDLLITDYDMPNQGGKIFIEKARSMSAYLYTPVILMTVAMKDQVEPKVAPLNVACLLQKPFDITNFYSIVEKLV